MANPFGFKALTTENWLLQDPIMDVFVAPASEGRFVKLEGVDWASRFLSPQLGLSVPFEVRRLFEVARGSMVYGWFFYPLYTLAAEQLFRVIEAAVRAKYQALVGKKDKKTYDQQIKALTKQSIIAAADMVDWDRLRELRNLASHPEYQNIFEPRSSLTYLELATKVINDLFA